MADEPPNAEDVIRSGDVVGFVYVYVLILYICLI